MVPEDYAIADYLMRRSFYSVFTDGKDAAIMLRLTRYKGIPPHAKLIAMQFEPVTIRELYIPYEKAKRYSKRR